ncbi:MAG: CoA-binding protein [Bacteroidales bacterium]|nr:CoA-binding protein [Bacteroidales bacterium]
MKTTKKNIENFFEPRKLAVAGASRNPRKFGHGIFKELVKRGYEVIPVNPRADEIDGIKCYHRVSEIPGEVKSLLIVTPREQTDNVLREAINKGISNIWVQQMSETEDTVKIAEEYQVEVIYRKCIYMFAEPVTGIHKFHRTIVKIFGRLPK